MWALNRLALSNDAHLADLVDAIDAIDAVATADAADHREAVTALRDRIADTVDAAVDGIGGPKPDDHPAVMAALQATLGDADATALLVDGRLREVPTGGMGALGLLPAPRGGGERAPEPAARARPRLGVTRASVPEPDAASLGTAVDEARAEQTAASVDESLTERRRSRERQRLERELVDAVTAREAAGATLDAAQAQQAAAAERLAQRDDEVAAAAAVLAEARIRRNEAADALTAAEATERSAADATTEAAEREAAARAACASLAGHDP